MSELILLKEGLWNIDWNRNSCFRFQFRFQSLAFSITLQIFKSLLKSLHKQFNFFFLFVEFDSQNNWYRNLFFRFHFRYESLVFFNFKVINGNNGANRIGIIFFSLLISIYESLDFFNQTISMLFMPRRNWNRFFFRLISYESLVIFNFDAIYGNKGAKQELESKFIFFAFNFDTNFYSFIQFRCYLWK